MLLDEGLEQLGRTSELDAETDDDLTDQGDKIGV